MLVEGAVEWIIEDVLTVVNGDWEMMTAIFVLELDTVRGVVQCVNFHGFYFCPYSTYSCTLHNVPRVLPWAKKTIGLSARLCLFCYFQPTTACLVTNAPNGATSS